MLEIVRYGEDEYDFPCLLVLGCFDGLHLGHAELLKKAKLQAKINGLDLGVMMFADGKGGKQLYSFEERTAFLEQYNVKFVLKVNFDEEFKKVKPLEFLECLEDKLNLKAYMSGKDFKFGQGKKGKASTLKSYADDEENSVWYMSVKEVTYEGEKISTSKIKEVLDAGDVKLAGELLGRNYSIAGTVVHGADRGGKVVGYPTMNVDFSTDKYPVKEGVYQVKAALGETVYDGIANYGARPTFGEDVPVLEVYLEGLDGEHYGEEVKVEFINYLRDIQKFDGAEELGEQLSKDIHCIDGEAELAVTESEAQPAEENSETEVETAEKVGEEQAKNFESEINHDDEFEAELDEEVTEESAKEEHIEENSSEQEPVEDVSEETLDKEIEEIAEDNSEIEAETDESSIEEKTDEEDESSDGITENNIEENYSDNEPMEDVSAESLAEENEEIAEENCETEVETAEATVEENTVEVSSEDTLADESADESAENND